MSEIARTDYKDDVLDTSKNAKRKYRMDNNSDGTVSLTDVSAYLQQGDEMNASVINTIFAMLGGWSIRVLTQEEFDALGAKEEKTLYFIKEE